MWDIGGQDKLRLLWKHYIDNTNVCLYLIDSTDSYSLNEAGNEMKKIVNESFPKDTIILFLLTKLDLEGNINENDIKSTWDLDNFMKDRIRAIKEIRNYENPNFFEEAFEWIEKAIREIK